MIGLATDAPCTTRRLVDALHLRPAGVDVDHAHLSVDLGSQSMGRHPILTVRNGARVVLRSREPDRIVTAASHWLLRLTSPRPQRPHVDGMTAVRLRSGRAVLMPSVVVADTALMERLLPTDVRWLDGRWPELGFDGHHVVVYFGDEPVPIGGVIVDLGTLEFDISTQARRAAFIAPRIRGRSAEAFDVAVGLATTVRTWGSIGGMSLREACLTAFEICVDL